MKSIIEMIDKMVKELSKIGKKKPFTIYIHRSQYNKEVADKCREDCLNIIVRNGEIVRKEL